MATAEIKYLGQLRTEVTHLQSKTTFKTDAPTDNQGKGEFISPTDLIAAALGACMQTIVGIYCQERNLTLNNCIIEVTKIMGSNPRRIVELHVNLDFRGNSWDEKTKRGVRVAAESCPVAQSIHPEILLVYEYSFDD
jgi:uncharacterized OsmC-like protein